jgi:hypothetical protein
MELKAEQNHVEKENRLHNQPDPPPRGRSSIRQPENIVFAHVKLLQEGRLIEKKPLSQNLAAYHKDSIITLQYVKMNTYQSSNFKTGGNMPFISKKAKLTEDELKLCWRTCPKKGSPKR